ncbi:unnamed protein product, partial [Arabidopsis halleri]
ISACKQGGQSVLEYYGRLTKLWEENYNTGRTCTCAAAPDIAKDREDDKVHQFLFGLDLPRFTNIRSTITGEDPLPNLNQVYSRVIREEQNLNVAVSTETTKTEAIDFSVKNNTRGNNSSPQRGGRPSRGRGRGRVNNTRAAAVTDTGTDQITQLISLLQSQRPQAPSDKLSGKTYLNDVIINTGASHHMTGDCSILVDVIDIVPSSVTFPDGRASRATKR